MEAEDNFGKKGKEFSRRNLGAQLQLSVQLEHEVCIEDEIKRTVLEFSSFAETSSHGKYLQRSMVTNLHSPFGS